MSPFTKTVWISLLPSAVLVLVALIQSTMAWRSELSPWKGGGFGMFSTVESPSSRLLRIKLVTNDGVFPVPLPDQYRNLAAEIRTWPTQEKLDQLAAALASANWTYYHVHPVQEEYYLQRSRYFPFAPAKPDSSPNVRYMEKFNQLFNEMSWITISSDSLSVDNKLRILEAEVSCMQMGFDQTTSRLFLTNKISARHKNNDH